MGKKVKGVRVAVDSSEGAPGSIVVTDVKNDNRAAIVAWKGSAETFTLRSSPGSGTLVPLGAGYVYRPSTIVTSTSTADDSSSFDYSPGPATPVVLFAATGGSGFVVQDFKPVSTSRKSDAKYTPSTNDTFVEPLWGDPGNGFIPMQVTSDPDATGGSASTNSLVSPINLVVLPQNDFKSAVLDRSFARAVERNRRPIADHSADFVEYRRMGACRRNQHAAGGQQPDHEARPAGAGHRRLY